MARSMTDAETEVVLPAWNTCIGFVVLTHQPDGTWRDDWDGEVHPTLEDGRAALSEASDAGCICILTRLTRVRGND